MNSIVFWRWLNPLAIFLRSDANYYTALELENRWPFLWFSANSPGGNMVLNLWTSWQRIAQYILGIMGFDTGVFLRIMYFLPVLFSTGIVFWVLRSLRQSKVASSLGALFFLFNTYYLSLMKVGHFDLMVAGILLWPAVLFFFRITHNPTWMNVTAYSMCVLCVFSYSPHIGYILLVLSGCMLLAGARRLLGYDVRRIALIGAIPVILLGVFAQAWLPLFFSNSLGSNDILQRTLVYQENFSLLRAFSVHHPFWDGGSDWFVVKAVPPVGLVLPIILLGGAVFSKRKRKHYYAFMLTLLAGLFLAKMTNQPAGYVYSYLFDQLPGFSAFREASKFYVLIIVGYVGLFYTVLTASRRFWKKIVISVACVTVVVFALPVFDGSMAGMYVPVTRPLYSGRAQEVFAAISTRVGYFRILSLPAEDKWLSTGAGYSKADLNTIMEQKWRQIPFARDSKNAPYIGVLSQPFSEYLLRFYGVRYLVIPKDNPDIRSIKDFSIYFNKKRDFYVDFVNQIDYLKKQDLGIPELDIYQVQNPFPNIFPFAQPGLLGPGLNLFERFSDMQKVLASDPMMLEQRPLQNTKHPPIEKIWGLFTDGHPQSGYREDGIAHLYVEKMRSQQRLIAVYNRTKRSMQWYLEELGYIRLSDIHLPDMGHEQAPGIAEISLDPSDVRNMFIARSMVDDVLWSFGSVGQMLDVGPVEAKERFRVFVRRSNLVRNYSLESGPWQPTVGDCNKFDNNPILGMSLNRQEKTDGRQSLQLEATRHTACVSTKIALPADTSGDYALSFDYQSPNGQKAGYYLQFDDEKKTVVRETPSIATSTWQSYAKKVTIPAGAKNARLYLYGYSLDEQTNVITRYDNVEFGKLELVKTIEIPQEEGYEKIPVTLKEGENMFEYVDPRYDYKNLLPNPSFETRPWQEKVGDCNRYDESPQLAMRLNEQEKTDGAKSLELEATRHTACMATTVPIKPGATYLLSFDYQSPNAKQASYYIGFNDPEKTSLKDQLTVTSTAWNAFSNTFTAPKGATSLSLYVYARETDKKTAIINRYDNFKLIEVPDLRDAFYLVSEPERKLVEPKSVEFELINPTKKLVHIKGATTPFFLGMSESHHDQWQLQFQNEKIQGVLKRWWPFAKPDRIADEYHYKLNGFLNAWYIDTDDWCATQGKCTKNADGSYDIEMVIEFWPQRWFYLGLLISGTTLAGCLGYLGYEGVRSVRRRLAARKKEAV